MKVLIVLSLAMALMGGVYSRSAGLFDDHERSADSAKTVIEERFKDNEAKEKSEKEADRFQSDINKGARDNLKFSDRFDTIVEFDTFDNLAADNQLSKSNKLAIQIVNDESHDQRDQIQKSSGTTFKNAVSKNSDYEADSAMYDNENVAAESVSQKDSAAAREAASENLLADASESLFDRGTVIKFEDLGRRHHDDDHDNGLFSGSSLFNGGLGSSMLRRFKLRSSAGIF